MAEHKELTAEQIRENYGPPQARKDDYFEKDGLRVYAPRSYKTSMLIGNPGSSVALATGWSDPEQSVDKGALDTFSIIASLRTPSGVELMLHNLASHPNITTVAVKAGRENDRTPQGLIPRNIVENLWANGVGDDGLVKGTNYRLRESLVADGAIEVVKKVLGGVDLVDWSKFSQEEINSMAQQLPVKSAYMEPVVLPEFKVEYQETMPSEEVSHMVRNSNAFDAWLDLSGRILTYGHNTPLETGSQTMVRELRFARVILSGEEPFKDTREWALNIPGVNVDQDSLHSYYKRFMRPESYMQEIYPGVNKFFRPANEKYLYAELLHAFPRPAIFDEAVTMLARDGGLQHAARFLRERSTSKRLPEEADHLADQVSKDDGLSVQEQVQILLEIYRPPVNQIANIVDRIRRMPDDADKVSVLWDPSVHGVSNSGRPCLYKLSFLTRGGVLDTIADFRTHDIGKAALLNYYGVWATAAFDIAAETGLKVGETVLNSESAHIYEGDIDMVSKIWQKEHLDMRPSQIFSADQADPRGNLLISVVDGQIVTTLSDPKTGKLVYEFRARTARAAIAQINHHGLVSQVSHGLDLGLQYSAAEQALRNNVEYTQDRPHEVFKHLKAD